MPTYNHAFSLNFTVFGLSSEDSKNFTDADRELIMDALEDAAGSSDSSDLETGWTDVVMEEKETMPQQQAINEIFEFQTEEARRAFIANLKTHFPRATWATARNGRDADGSFICAVTQEAIDAETE